MPSSKKERKRKRELKKRRERMQREARRRGGKGKELSSAGAVPPPHTTFPERSALHFYDFLAETGLVDEKVRRRSADVCTALWKDIRRAMKRDWWRYAFLEKYFPERSPSPQVGLVPPGGVYLGRRRFQAPWYQAPACPVSGGSRT